MKNLFTVSFSENNAVLAQQMFNSYEAIVGQLKDQISDSKETVIAFGCA
jgi:hypothetical protein